MAAFHKLWKERNRILEAVCESCRVAEENREREHKAAIKIQSWFRGCQVRAYIKYLSKCATLIQKTYRGHYGRRYYRQLLKDHLINLRKNYYDKMATIIQCTWRGYYSRQYIHNYYVEKRYLAALKEKNEIVRSRLESHQQKIINEQLKRDDELEKLRTAKDARQCHYMLSTQSSNGVFTGPEGSLPIEDQMRAIKFHLPHVEKRQHPKSKGQSSIQSLSPNSTHPTVDLAACSGDCRLRHSLPPVKPQGPFRQPEKVWEQRRRPLNPSLRVATSFDSVCITRSKLKAKEQINIVVNDKFVPFSKSPFPYQPMLDSQTYYTRPDYGTKHFRDESPDNHVTQQRFQTVIPPIALFDHTLS